MSRLNPNFVLGYHGCDTVIADKIFSGKEVIIHSQNNWDWLGSGAYFWEGDPKRAMEWANQQVQKKKYSKAAVVGAIIDLGNCLNFSTQEAVDLLKVAFDSYQKMRAADGKPLALNKPENESEDADILYRALDNAVIERIHAMIKSNGGAEPFDTVRGMFHEGKQVYEGAGFREKTHVQIAVRSQNSIIGYFRPKKG